MILIFSSWKAWIKWLSCLGHISELNPCSSILPASKYSYIRSQSKAISSILHYKLHLCVSSFSSLFPFLPFSLLLIKQNKTNEQTQSVLIIRTSNKTKKSENIDIISLCLVPALSQKEASIAISWDVFF